MLEEILVSYYGLVNERPEKLFIIKHINIINLHNYYQEQKYIMSPNLDFQLEHYGCERR
jgi:hypothetical protein